MRRLLPPDDWPLRQHSRHIAARPHLWHVQDFGPEGAPRILCLHGAGGAGHSFRALAPLLAGRWRVTVLDLPGQGFSTLGARQRCGLYPMAEDIGRLCAEQGWRPAAILGHSAGAAIALRLADTLPDGPRAVVGINAALSPFQGVAGVMFPMMARLLAMNPMVPQVFARLWRDAAQVDRLIRATGSAIDAPGLACYLRLVREPQHVDATLAMMAQWRLDGLRARLPALAVPALLVTGAGDRAVPPEVSAEAAGLNPGVRHVALARGGHLLHEEDAAAVMAEVEPFLAAHLA